MAQEDLDNMVVSRQEAPVTAGQALHRDFNGDGFVDLEAVNRAAAAEAGVKNAAFINYDTALAAHAARNDIEDLAHKNARDMPANFADAAFMRRTDTSQWDNEFVGDDVNGAAPVVDYPAGVENLTSGYVYDQVGGDVDSDNNPSTPASGDEAANGPE